MHNCWPCDSVFISVSICVCTNACTDKHMGVKKITLLCVCVCVCLYLSMSVHAVPPVTPRCVCVCHYPAGAALMEAVISNAVN